MPPGHPNLLFRSQRRLVIVSGSEPIDPDTIAYFDAVVPEYGVYRLEGPVKFIAEHMDADSSLIDVGSGTGNTLAHVREQTGISNLAALDVSGECLRVLKTRLDCEVLHGSILDTSLIEGIGPRFDFVVLAAVLHHLIGRSRRQSSEYAALAVENSKRLLAPGGHLLIVEPVFSPRAAMTAVFYLKKAITKLTSSRVGILGYGNNIGAPVVSYYTPRQLSELANTGAPCTVVHSDNDPEGLPSLLELILERDNIDLFLRKGA